MTEARRLKAELNKLNERLQTLLTVLRYADKALDNHFKSLTLGPHNLETANDLIKHLDLYEKPRQSIIHHQQGSDGSFNPSKERISHQIND